MGPVATDVRKTQIPLIQKVNSDHTSVEIG
jgi:hypothetical protein